MPAIALSLTSQLAALSSATRSVAQPVHPRVVRPVLATRPTQILKSAREPLQLSLFPRPSGAR